MTWADYHPIPGADWADPNLKPTKKQFRVALIAIDFPDQPFVITLPKHSDLFGNPQIDPVTREKVAQFYADFYNTPSAVNHGHTINGYWMEQSRGQIGIAKLDAFGPYNMPKNLYRVRPERVRPEALRAGRRPVMAAWNPMPTPCGPTPLERTSSPSTISSSAFTPAMTKPASGRNSAR